jgi:rod shape determining protein RodA
MTTAELVRRLRTLDWSLLTVTLLLSAFGLAAIYSLSLAGETTTLSLFARQLTALAVGLAALFALAGMNYRRLRPYAPVLVVAALVLLLGVLFFGTRVGGTRGWYIVLGQSFQPVEFAKLVFAVALARYLADHHDDPPGRRLALSVGLLGVFVVPVLLQPDIGSALLFVAVWAGIVAIADLPRPLLIRLVLALLVVAALAWFAFPQAQQERVLTFLNPARDPLGAGYNVRQSIVAIGSGQMFGRGLGLGPLSQLNFLPTAETDFIFAVIGEELGLVGTLLLLGFFAFFLLRLVRHLSREADRFGRYVTGGILSLFTVQVLVNIGMNLGLAPVTGVPLPFVSYGGSALITSLAAVGLVESIVSRSRQIPLA